MCCSPRTRCYAGLYPGRRISCCIRFDKLPTVSVKKKNLQRAGVIFGGVKLTANKTQEQTDIVQVSSADQHDHRNSICARTGVNAFMPKKPVGILKRNAHPPKSAGSPKRKQKHVKSAAEIHADSAQLASNSAVVSAVVSPASSLPEQQQLQFWSCQSEVDRQAATCIGKVLASDASKRNGKTIKSLTLAPHIKAKKAVYAVTCQTLQCASL